MGGSALFGDRRERRIAGRVGERPEPRNFESGKRIHPFKPAHRGGMRIGGNGQEAFPQEFTIAETRARRFFLLEETEPLFKKVPWHQFTENGTITRRRDIEAPRGLADAVLTLLSTRGTPVDFPIVK
jgi:hypothetical protein